jgi:uncharacterized membrane protein YidH (DUF202 family)
MNDRTKDDVNRFAVRPTVDTHFSWLRTRMSTERTLMSWVRTATALIGFGFTIVQFFERFGKMEFFQHFVQETCTWHTLPPHLPEHPQR